MLRFLVHPQVLIVFLILATGASRGIAGDWDIIHQDGRDYVSVQNIHSFYGFEKMTENRDEESAELVHPSVVLHFDKKNAADLVLANGVKFQLLHPIVGEEKGKRLLVSAKDLACIIDPVVRPSANPRPARDNLVQLTLFDPPRGFDIGLLHGAISKSGWKVAEQEELKAAVLKLEIAFQPLPGDPDAGRVKTFWQRTKNKGFGAGSRSDYDSLYFATALHAQLVEIPNLHDDAIVPTEPVDKEPGNPAAVRIELALPHDFVSRKSLIDGIAEALKREAKFRSEKENEEQ